MARPLGSTNTRPTLSERRALLRQLKDAALAGDTTAALALANMELAEEMRERLPPLRDAESDHQAA